MTSKGQTTIPKEIRDRLHLQAGDRIDFIAQNDGTVLLRPVKLDVTALKGLLHRPGIRPVSLAEMKNAIRRRARRP